MKKTILHIIYKLGRGGAELMLIRVIKELPEYNNIVLSLSGDNPFGGELKCDKYIAMNWKSLFSLPFGVIKFRRIIKQNNIDLVHSHLLWPTVIARIATSRKIPLVTTIHTSVSTSLDYQLWRVRLVDKITYCLRKNIIIGVSKVALKEYFNVLKLKPFETYLLYTFVDTKRFNYQPRETPRSGNKFLIITVSALRAGKNIEYLIKAFSKLKKTNIELHVYGSGPLNPKLKKMIAENEVNVILKGEVPNIHELLPKYDLYISASAFEGFSLSVLEAMAMGLPLLLSDISSFREQCADTAVYFGLNDTENFINQLNLLIADSEKRNIISEKARKRVLGNFTLSHHVVGLKKIYNSVFLNKLSH